MRTAITILLILIILASGCVGEAQHTGDINPVISGVLKAEEPPDAGLFSATVASLVQGDQEGYLNGLAELNSTIEPMRVSKVVVEGRRDSTWPYRGLYLFDVRDMRYALAHVDQVKAAGVDSVMLQVNFQADPETGKAYVPGEDAYLFYISAFQKSEFRVLLIPALQMYFVSREEQGMPLVQDRTTRLPELEAHALRWAEIAERYNVDAFMPSDEAQRLFIEEGESAALCTDKRPALNEWMQGLLPKIRERFSGQVGFATDDGGPCERMGTADTRLGPDFDYSGYDFVVYKYPFPSVFESDEHWEEHTFNWSMPFIANFSARDNVDGIILYEAGDTVGPALEDDFAGLLPVRNSNEEHQKEMYEKFFTLAEEYPQVSLFFKISDTQPHEPSWNPFNRPAEGVLKENYAEVYGTLPVTELDELWMEVGGNGLKAIQMCITDEIPFDSDERNYEAEYDEFYSRVRELCR